MAERPEFTLGMFSPYVGDTFRLEHDSGTEYLLKLVEAAACESQDSRPRENFSLVFHDPSASASSFLPQAIYPLQHEKLARLEVFIVPIGPPADGQGICYEAVFA